jgi:hypothetical protein
MGAIHDFLDFIKDAFWISKLTITSPWLWLMLGFGVYICIMPWMMLAIHPATVLVVPGVLIVYLVISEDKRVATQYGLNKKEDAAGAVKWDVTKSVDEYMQVLNKRITFDEDRREDFED